MLRGFGGQHGGIRVNDDGAEDVLVGDEVSGVVRGVQALSVLRQLELVELGLRGDLPAEREVWARCLRVANGLNNGRA